MASEALPSSGGEGAELLCPWAGPGASSPLGHLAAASPKPPAEAHTDQASTGISRKDALAFEKG